MSYEPKQGDTVYDITGRSARYLCAGTGGHIVEPIYDLDRGEEVEYEESAHHGHAETWHFIYTKPPIAQKHAEIEAMSLTLRDTEALIEATREETNKLVRGYAEMRKRIAAHPDLQDLDLWLQSRVTHIVSLADYNGGFSINTVEEALNNDDREHTVRLLNLRVDPKAERYWVGYSSYNDGSGSQTRCLLATSLEHAKERAAAYVQDLLKKPDDYHHSAIAACIKHGIPVSDAHMLKHDDIVRKAASNQLEQAAATVQRANADYNRALEVVRSVRATDAGSAS